MPKDKEAQASRIIKSAKRKIAQVRSDARVIDPLPREAIKRGMTGPVERDVSDIAKARTEQSVQRRLLKNVPKLKKGPLPMMRKLGQNIQNLAPVDLRQGRKAVADQLRKVRNFVGKVKLPGGQELEVTTRTGQRNKARFINKLSKLMSRAQVRVLKATGKFPKMLKGGMMAPKVNPVGLRKRQAAGGGA